jgi:hypothetical protein
METKLYGRTDTSISLKNLQSGYVGCQLITKSASMRESSSCQKQLKRSTGEWKSVVREVVEETVVYNDGRNAKGRIPEY